MNKTTVTGYPLQWPRGWPRTEKREPSRFKTTLAAALNFLKEEVGRLGGKNLVLSSNVSLGNERVADVGVVAYFELRGQHIAVPCDRWQNVQDNVKAIGLTIEAMRGMERWGAKHMITAMFSGFKALPEKSGRSPWEILEIRDDSTESEVLAQYRKLATRAHPDAGGSVDAFRELCEAKDVALATIRSR
jgi:hypothetical protein